MKLQKRASQVGFDWPNITPVFDKINEELNEVKQELGKVGNENRIDEEIGDLLFACTNLARHARVNPEAALRSSNLKFEKRFSQMEKLAAIDSLNLENVSLDTWEQLWEQVKIDERIQGSSTDKL
jgi:ATP diphosphatase